MKIQNDLEEIIITGSLKLEAIKYLLAPFIFFIPSLISLFLIYSIYSFYDFEFFTFFLILISFFLMLMLFTMRRVIYDFKKRMFKVSKNQIQIRIPSQKEFIANWSEIEQIELENFNINEGRSYPRLKFIKKSEQRVVVIRFPKNKISEIIFNLEKYAKKMKVKYVIKEQDKRNKNF